MTVNDADTTQLSLMSFSVAAAAAATSAVPLSRFTVISIECCIVAIRPISLHVVPPPSDSDYYTL